MEAVDGREEGTGNLVGGACRVPAAGGRCCCVVEGGVAEGLVVISGVGMAARCGGATEGCCSCARSGPTTASMGFAAPAPLVSVRFAVDFAGALPTVFGRSAALRSAQTFFPTSSSTALRFDFTSIPSLRMADTTASAGSPESLAS